jgi:LysR family nitrogen assimilation transcriptional regulator
MESRLLEYFLRVAELGSINKAAADLRLSQPALSRHIATLESEMGSQLFTRSQSGVHLTESGKLLSERSRPLLRQFAILREQVGESAAGQLSIGVPPAWYSIFTTPFIERLVAQFPHIALRVHSGVSHSLQDAMMAGVLDLCVLPFAAAPPVGFKQTPLLREPMLLVAAARHGLKRDEPTSFDRLEGVRLVLPAKPSVVRSHVEHMLSRKGVRHGSTVETDSMNLCLALARRGVGMTIVPACSVIEPVDGKELSWSPIRGLFLTWALFENQARSHAPAVREGRRMLLATLHSVAKSSVWPGVQTMGHLDRAAGEST